MSCLGCNTGMKLEYVWIVRDPSPHSYLSDICWEQPINSLDRYILGAGPETWASENHSVYTSKKEALEDAKKRLSLRDKGLHPVRRQDGQVVHVTIPED